ncbi:MAG TPA: Ig-like domain-containing protein [Acidimicrobiales bacterium]|nr:Ig-like domain-containing protein [Acidimicrobiales bacterium]
MLRRGRSTRRRRAALAALALVSVSLAPTAVGPANAAIAQPKSFWCIDNISQQWRVPDKVTRVHIMAGGGEGGWGSTNGGTPGKAAIVGGEAIVVPTFDLYIKVACAGGADGRGGWGHPYSGYTGQSGGNGGYGDCCQISRGGGGGGASVVSHIGWSCGNDIDDVTGCIVAGGGGGGGGGTSCGGTWGGNGGYGGEGGQNGANGNSGSAGRGGAGASQTALNAPGGSGGPGGGRGEAGDPSLSSSAWVGLGGDGGNGASGACYGGGGGGGGAGHRGAGGGGGGGAGHGGGGGGGGSSWMGPLIGAAIVPAANTGHGFVTITPLAPDSAAVRATAYPQGATTAQVGGSAWTSLYVYDQYGNPMPNTDVVVNVNGVHTRTATIRTGSWGYASYSYTGSTIGADVVRFSVGGLALAAVGVLWQPGTTSTSVVVSPSAQNVDVGSYATVTATVRDAYGNPVPNVSVRFTRSFANPGQATVATNADGEARHTYRCSTQGVDDIEAVVPGTTSVPGRAEVACVSGSVPTSIPDPTTTSTTSP